MSVQVWMEVYDGMLVKCLPLKLPKSRFLSRRWPVALTCYANLRQDDALLEAGSQILASFSKSCSKLAVIQG